MTMFSAFRAGFILLPLGMLLSGCPSDITTKPQVADLPATAQVANNSGGRIDHVNVGNVTFTQNLSYNTTQYGSDNGSYCGDGCSTGFTEVAEGTGAITVSQTTTSGAVQLGSLGPFQKNKYFSVNIRRVNGNYCAELWLKLDTSTIFNLDTTRVLVSSTCTA